MKNERKGITVAGETMANQPDHSDICLVSTIIKDGVKNYDELIKKFASCKNLSLVVAKKRIKEMQKEGKIGYYHSKYSYYYETVLYYFTKWVPEERKHFSDSKLYKTDKKKYFKPFFNRNYD